MTILELTKLNTVQTNQIEQLLKLCNSCDHTHTKVLLDNLLNVYPSMNSWFLAYRGGLLAGYISLFAPSKDKSELSAHTHPEMRGQGVFTSLYAAAAREMLKYNYRHLFFLCPHDSIPAKAVATRCGAVYAFTEYMMRYDRNRPVTPSRNRLTILEASHDQEAELIALSKSVFPDTSDDAENMVKSRSDLPNWKIMVSMLEGNLIGICSLGFERDSLSINGFGIQPEYRKKGYGREFLEKVLAEIVTGDREIRLDVDSTNRAAYHLYRQIGFTVVSAVDYYQMEINSPDI